MEDSIHRSKAVGEPPLLLPFSVFFAIRDAIAAVGDYRINPPLRAPATSEAILDAVDSGAGGARLGGGHHAGRPAQTVPLAPTPPAGCAPACP